MEQKKKPMLSYFIPKTDDIYNRAREKAFLSEDDFVERVDFKFGLPLVVLDFIDHIAGSDFIRLVQTYVNP